jgi:hypothetical protein
MYKYKYLVLFLIMVTLTIFSSCNKHLVEHKAERQYYYTCPMHPDDIYYQPAKCPKCGMVLDAWNIEDMPRKKASSSNLGNPASGGHSGHNH